MITLVIFLIITAAEAVFVYVQLQRIEDFNSIGNITTEVLGVNDRYKGATSWAVNKIVKLKKYVWIPVLFTLFVNFIAAAILGFVIGLFI